MYMPADKIVDNMLQGARQAAETNLKLQQEFAYWVDTILAGVFWENST